MRLSAWSNQNRSIATLLRSRFEFDSFPACIVVWLERGEVIVSELVRPLSTALKRVSVSENTTSLPLGKSVKLAPLYLPEKKR